MDNDKKDIKKFFEIVNNLSTTFNFKYLYESWEACDSEEEFKSVLIEHLVNSIKNRD